MEKLEEKVKGFCINPSNLDQIIKAGVDLNSCFLLHWYSQGIDITEHTSASKVLSWRQLLIRNNYLKEDNSLTELGNDLLDSIGNMEAFIVIKREKAKKVKEGFDLWWSEIYPSTNAFEIDGVTFEGIQSKKVKKPLSKEHYLGFVREGKYTAEEINNATKYHIDMAKKISKTKGENQLSFIANTERYLREEMFEPYIGRVIKEEGVMVNLKDLYGE